MTKPLDAMLTDKCRLCFRFTDLDPFTMLCFRCYLKHYGAFNEPKRRKAKKRNI